MLNLTLYKMEIKKLDFIEQYIDEKPTENYWRGISAICDGIKVFEIPYVELFREPSYFYIRPTIFPITIFDTNLGELDFDILGKKYTSKKEAKKQCQVIFEKYIKLFVK